MFGLRLARSRVRCTSKARRSWRAFFAPGFSTNAKRANDIAPVETGKVVTQLFATGGNWRHRDVRRRQKKNPKQNTRLGFLWTRRQGLSGDGVPPDPVRSN